MLSSRNIVVHFIFVCCIGAAHVPGRVSRDIASTDTILHVVKEIFSCLKFKLNGTINNKLPIHNYFVGFSQYKSNNWKEILRLTSFDIKIDNSSTDYMSTIINEILKGGNKTEGEIEIRNDVSVNKESKNFLRKTKQAYLRNIPYSTLNDKTSQLLHKGRTSQSTFGKITVTSELNLVENGTEDVAVWMPSQTRRVFKGQQTSISYYPFMASIHIFSKFTCAGSLIANDLVITAASCLQLAHNNRLYRENPLFLAVRVGSSYYYSDGDLIPVLEVYFYPSYDPKNLQNNLAIVRLSRYIRHRDRSNVMKVAINTNANALPMNTDGIVIVGWGAKTPKNKINIVDKIAQSVLDFYPLEDCQEIYSKTYVTQKHFCGGFISRGGGACNRDVGAPGLAGGLLVGVVSFGSASCGATDAPTVFTKLGYYTNWIEEIMQEKREYVKREMTTHRPDPVRTITMPPPTSPEFAVEPLHTPMTPALITVAQTRDISEEFLSSPYQQNPAISYVSNEEPAVEQQFTNKEQMVDGNIEHAQEHADLLPEQYISSATTTQKNISQEDLSHFNLLDKSPQSYEFKSKSNEAGQQPKPVHSISRVGLPRDEEYTEAKTETELTSNKEQFVSLETKGDSFVGEQKSFSNAGQEFAMNNPVVEKSSEPAHDKIDAYEEMATQLTQNALPNKLSSNGKSPGRTFLEKLADPSTIDEGDLMIEQPEVTADPRLNQQINELIDYINIIDVISSEQE